MEAAFPSEASRFLRMRFRMLSGNKYRGVSWAAGAYAKLWIDGMGDLAPWLQTASFAQAPAAEYSSSWRIGGFNNNGLQVGGQFSFEHANLAIGTSFDPAW